MQVWRCAATVIDLELCSDGVGLLLEAAGCGYFGCRRYHEPLLDRARSRFIERVRAWLPPSPPSRSTMSWGADAAKIRIGDARTAEGELEVHVDGCDTPALAVLAARPGGACDRRNDAAGAATAAACRAVTICAYASHGRTRNPLWALDWIEIGE